ncbi:RNA polymerase sigma factor [Haliangium sp.]|uniref:RNA polymerase sigma factor n=1 Tax=Haliangium sp. TaxID=2663208 RepID=UPI003D14B4AF
MAVAATSSSCDPDEIVRLMRAGDVAALDGMTRCYGERLLAAGRRYCGDEERARDAVQETMLAAGLHLGDFRGDGSLEGWLVRMVSNFCHHMQRGRKNDAGLHVEYDDTVAARADSPEDEAARGQLMQILGDAMLDIDPRDRALLILADAEDWSAPELATALDMTPAGVRTRLSRARRRLREQLGATRDALD